MKYPLVAVIGLSAAACGASPAVERTAPPTGVSPASLEGAKAKLDGALLESYLRNAREAWETKDAARFADLYTKDARITVIGEEERTLGEALDEMSDGPLTLSFVRGLLNGQEAVVEWVHGGPHPARSRIAARGASVLSFSTDGRVRREIRYFDSSTLGAQLGAGWRHCLPHRPPLAAPDSAPSLHLGSEQDSGAAARAWIGAAKGSGSPSSIPVPVPVSNLFLPADGPGASGMGEAFAQAFQNISTTVTRCISSPALVACEIEHRGTFTAPLIGLKPTGRTGTTHWLEVAEVRDSKVTAVTAYGNGKEIVRAFVDLDDNGFLSPAQVIDPAPCQ